MAGRSRGRNPNNRFHYVKPRHEHDDRDSRPSTSRGGGGGYPNRHHFNKKVSFKANSASGGNHFRKSWDNKTDLVREHLLDSEFSNRNVLSRNNSSRRSYPERNHNRGHGGNHRTSSWTLKESSTGFYSVYVPNVENSEEVLKIIQTYVMPVTFYPYNKQYFDNALRFLVDDHKVANTLHNTSYKLTLRDDRKLIIKVFLYIPQRGTISFTPVSNEVKEKMIEAMAVRYNPSTKSLDLSKFYACSLFTDNQLFVPLNRPSVLLAALNIVAQHTKNDLFGLSLENNHIYLGEGLIWIRRLFPELKVLDLAGNKFSDLKELKCLSGFSLEVLNLSRNPVCDTEDKERYRRDVQQIFPSLTKLDNSDVQSQYNSVIAGSKLKMPINLGNSYPVSENPEVPNPVVTLVESFLTQFYELYDNQVSRQLVAEAYHEKATFSTTSCFLSCFCKGSLGQYLPESRNFLKNDQNKNLKNRFLRRGRENIVNFMDKLPKTKHDLGSFTVDVPFATAVLVQIVVNGTFAEDFKETNHRQVFRSFCRTFCIVPVGSGWSILSDIMFITVVSEELLMESSKRFHIFKPKPESRKKRNLNDNSDNSNVTMFVEDTDEMYSMEASTSCLQLSTPSYPPPPYQQTSMSYQQSINQQAPPPYQSNMSTSNIQNQQTTLQQQNHFAATSTTPVSFQTNSQQSNAPANTLFPMFNATQPITTTSFPNSSTISSAPVNQQLTEVPLNSISSSTDKLTMIKSFSNESGMNNEWAKKCLEENDWDYSKAAACFSKLKANIPPAAFVQ